MTKGLRADLHERCAEWIEARPDAPPELDEILGHHLEQAHAYRADSRRPALPRRFLPCAPRRWLVRAGERSPATTRTPRRISSAGPRLCGLGRACSSTTPRPFQDRRLRVAEAGELALAVEAAEAAAMPAVRSPPDSGSTLIGLLVRGEGGSTKSPTRSTAPCRRSRPPETTRRWRACHPACGRVLVALSGRSDGGDARARTRARPPRRRPAAGG